VAFADSYKMIAGIIAAEARRILGTPM
jgi:hypothetical protein